MAMYWTCKYGTNHDCGERCDCEEEIRREKDFEKKKFKNNFFIDNNGQLTFNALKSVKV